MQDDDKIRRGPEGEETPVPTGPLDRERGEDAQDDGHADLERDERQHDTAPQGPTAADIQWREAQDEANRCKRNSCRETREIVRHWGILFWVVLCGSIAGLLWQMLALKWAVGPEDLGRNVAYRSFFESAIILALVGFAARVLDPLIDKIAKRAAGATEEETEADNHVYLRTCMRDDCRAQRELVQAWTAVFVGALMCGFLALAWSVVTQHGHISAGQEGTFCGFLFGGLLGFLVRWQARQRSKAEA